MDFGRLVVAMASPFDGELRLDLEQAGNLARRLAGDGIDSLVVGGTTGESPTLSRQERIDLVVEARRASGLPVISNAGTNDTRMSVQYARDAEEAGADGLLLVAPYYNKPDQDMLYDHFAAIARSVRIPSMLYNVPSRTGVSIRPETTVRLSRDVPGITMLKDAQGDLDAMTVVIRDAAPGFRVYTGEDALTLPSLAVGAWGVVSVAAHVVGRLMKRMIGAYLAGDVRAAAEMHRSLQAIDRALFLQPNPVPLKKALELTGFDAGKPRPPLKEASVQVADAIREALAALPPGWSE